MNNLLTVKTPLTNRLGLQKTYKDVSGKYQLGNKISISCKLWFEQ